MNGIIKFNLKAWSKPYHDMKNRIILKKNFFELMNTSVFAKTMENVTKRQELKQQIKEEVISCQNQTFT